MIFAIEFTKNTNSPLPEMNEFMKFAAEFTNFTN